MIGLLNPCLFWRSGRAAPKDGSEASFSGRPGSGGGHWAAVAAAAAALPLDALTCRLTSLDYLLARLPVLSATLLEKCASQSCCGPCRLTALLRRKISYRVSAETAAHLCNRL